MWSSVVDGRWLTFVLAAINNQNFIMRDVQTGTWWQQVTGEAVRGPLRGKRLIMLDFDEVNLAIWRREHPGSLILLPDEEYEEHYAAVDWDEDFDSAEFDGVPAPPVSNLPAGFESRSLVVGVSIGGSDKAYPMDALTAASVIVDRFAGRSILVVVDDDGRSVRCFDREVGGQVLDLFRQTVEPAVIDPDSGEVTPLPLVLVDAQTGSTWDFAGRAVGGELEGQSLRRIPAIKDYWFDWEQHHPGTFVYSAPWRKAPSLPVKR